MLLCAAQSSLRDQMLGIHKCEKIIPIAQYTIDVSILLKQWMESYCTIFRHDPSYTVSCVNVLGSWSVFIVNIVDNNNRTGKKPKAHVKPPAVFESFR